ncbi:uncharacterized protein C8R40DRAFT_1166620 [Lentinula edodes]|uniref:uncharacterized protein n=1 Tax=Lentinula edodes TaxID=5353 RepID=UPI001E8DF879|nr:uncharacterized protein C8R40DRAFT_1166620 [Lentinula edodes]KAH7879377.1 hypothetical protein C8R40DRAFT_1166620 [Lentinula edodes]
MHDENLKLSSAQGVALLRPLATFARAVFPRPTLRDLPPFTLTPHGTASLIPGPPGSSINLPASTQPRQYTPSSHDTSFLRPSAATNPI